MTTLVLEDAQTAADLQTFVRRAAALDREGGVRLQAVGEVLAVYAAVLPGTGLDASGLVLGMRAMRLAAPADVDVTVPISALLDRFAREASAELPVPPAQVRLPWAGQGPPRSGWEPAGEIPAAALDAAAAAGIEEVAQGAGRTSAALAVSDLRRRVWARPLEGTAVPSGMAFAARSLGLIDPAPARIYACGRWIRLSTGAGHVLARP